jgi:hypothetical protein
MLAILSAMAESERRYTEDEIANIFANAAEQGVARTRTSGSSGLTLPELQQIGSEVGLSPEAVADAAARLDNPAVTWRHPAVITKHHFWLPVEAGKTIELPRRLSDQEWTQLVADLRTTFDARGRVEETANKREWRGGGAHAVLTHTDNGARFQLSSFRRQGIVMLWAAVVSFNVAAITFFIAAAGLSDDVDILRTSVFSAIAGTGIVMTTALKLRAWARLARQQVDGVVARLLGTFG